MTADRIKQIPRTGETEIHQMPGLLTRYGQRRFYATEKLDGFPSASGALMAVRRFHARADD